MTPLEHSVCSLELNPIQNVWGWIIMSVSSTVHTLYVAIFNNWNNILPSLQSVLEGFLSCGLKYVIR